MQTHRICGAKEEHINPASLDLTTTNTIYRIDEVFIPRPGEPIAEILKEVSAAPHDSSQPLERGVTYIAKLKETLKLPKDIYAHCNPKSSTGRNDIHVRVVAEGVPRFDSLPAGYTGGLWITIMPLSFPIMLGVHERLAQIRFANEDTRLSELELQIALERDKLLWQKERTVITYDDISITDRDGSFIMTADISQELVGWECVSAGRVLDISKRSAYEPHEFFRPLMSVHGKVRLKQGAFYILHTRERLRVPPYLAAEVVPMDERTGEFRSHYAGFIDPGWGWGSIGEGIGRPIVLEVRPFLQDLVLRDRQPIAKLRFERLMQEPEKLYDQINTSNYRTDSSVPVLSKHFITPHVA